MWRWLTDALGINSASSRTYLFWSGIGANLTTLGVVGSIYQAKTCDIRHCHRLARHRVKGTDWTVCSKHAPNPRPTVDDLKAAIGEADLPIDKDAPSA